MPVEPLHFVKVAGRGNKLVIPELNDSDGNQISFGLSQLGRCTRSNQVAEYTGLWF